MEEKYIELIQDLDFLLVNPTTLFIVPYVTLFVIIGLLFDRQSCCSNTKEHYSNNLKEIGTNEYRGKGHQEKYKRQ